MVINIEKVRELRGTRKQIDVASQIGISQNFYSQIEAGKRTPSLKLAIAIARAFDVKLDDLLLDGEELNIQDIQSQLIPDVEEITATFTLKITPELLLQILEAAIRETGVRGERIEQ